VAADSRIDLDERRLRDDDRRGAPPGGARQLSAILPNGRTIWLQVDAPLAPAATVAQLAHTAEVAADQRQSGSLAQREAIDRVASTLAAETGRVDEARLERARALRRRIVRSGITLDTRLSKARDEFHTRIEKQLKIDRENVRRLRRRDLWDKILIATALPLFAAYGQRGDLLGSNNLTLVLSLLIFLVGDEVVEAIFGSDQATSAFAVQDADIWSYLAPIGNVAAGWWLLSDQQHERFITGITPVKLEEVRAHATHGRTMYHYKVEVDLERRIAPDHFADFETFANVPVVATLRKINWSPEGLPLHARIERLTARVEEGKLKITFYAVPARGWKRRPYPTTLGTVDIAWMVDTKQPTPPAPTSG
jgi:RNAse (barnase) inhibitor barstar